jgi:hypothetical protein
MAIYRYLNTDGEMRNYWAGSRGGVSILRRICNFPRAKSIATRESFLYHCFGFAKQPSISGTVCLIFA